jgi:hypothetical protein
MAKKKKIIDLKSKNLSFCENGIEYRLLRFKAENMTLDVIRYENEQEIDEFNIPFAHIPKALKKIIKPK